MPIFSPPHNAHSSYFSPPCSHQGGREIRKKNKKSKKNGGKKYSNTGYRDFYAAKQVKNLKGA